MCQCERGTARERKIKTVRECGRENDREISQDFL